MRTMEAHLTKEQPAATRPGVSESMSSSARPPGVSESAAGVSLSSTHSSLSRRGFFGLGGVALGVAGAAGFLAAGARPSLEALRRKNGILDLDHSTGEFYWPGEWLPLGWYRATFNSVRVGFDVRDFQYVTGLWTLITEVSAGKPDWYSRVTRSRRSDGAWISTCWALRKVTAYLSWKDVNVALCAHPSRLPSLLVEDWEAEPHIIESSSIEFRRCLPRKRHLLPEEVRFFSEEYKRRQAWTANA